MHDCVRDVEGQSFRDRTAFRSFLHPVVRAEDGLVPASRVLRLSDVYG